MNWKEYHTGRRQDFLIEKSVTSIRQFSDDDKIALAEAGATCYHPTEKNGWDTREWLESIYSVFHHGCCNGCKAVESCRAISL